MPEILLTHEGIVEGVELPLDSTAVQIALQGSGEDGEIYHYDLEVFIATNARFALDWTGKKVLLVIAEVE